MILKRVMRRDILDLFFILVEKQLVVLPLSMILTVDFLCVAILYQVEEFSFYY